MQIFTTLLSYDHGILRQVLDVMSDITENDTWEQNRDALPDAADFLQRFMEERFGASFQADMEEFANRLQDRVMGKGVIKYGPMGP